MNKLFKLTKVLLKSGFGGRNKKGRNRQMLLMLLVAVSLTPLMVQIVKFISKSYDVLVGIDQQGVILSLGITTSAFAIFFFGIFYVMNTFYFSNDIENLLPLPLKPSQIMGAKFITVTIYEYITEIIFLLPILVTFGIKSGAGIGYYAYAAFIFLLLPVIPLAIASFIVMILMRFTNIAKNKDRFKLIGGIVGLFIGLSINFVIQRFSQRGMDPGQLADMLQQGNNSLINITSKMFPSSQFAAFSLTNSMNFEGFTNFLLFLGITALFFGIFMYLGELLYFKGVLGMSQAVSKRRKITGKELEKGVTRQSAVRSYLQKEVRLLFRTPIYFLNCVLMNFLWPVFILIFYFTQSGSSEILDKAREYVFDGSYHGIVLAISFALAVFISSTNGVTPTSISREGENLFITRYLPISFKNQIIAKVLSGVTIGAIGLFTMLVTFGVIFKLPLYLIGLITVVGGMGILFSSLAGMVLDLFNPKLHWDTEQKAVKQNMNVVFSMIIGIAFAGATAYGVVTLKLGLLVTALLIIGVYGILNIMLYLFLSTKGVELFRRLES